jgi:hypothetical protein
MKILQILYKHFKHSLSVAIKLSKLNNERYLFLEIIRIFIIRFFFAFPYIRNKILISKNINEQNLDCDFFTNKKINSNEIIEQLDNLGFYEKLQITEEKLNQIKKNINSENCYLDKKGYENKDKNIKTTYNDLLFNNLDDILNFSNKNKVNHLVIKFKDNKNFITNFATSSFFIYLAKKYLHTTNLSVRAQCYISNPFNSSYDEKKRNAQVFHYDCDYKKFFKVFIYLSDVDELSGPHIYMEKTHKKKFLEHIVAERFDDEEILNKYGNDKKKVFVNRQGSVIIEDTFGFHKGEPPKSQTRSMIIFEYGIGKSIIKDDQYLSI